jgi:chloramphenicol-sensitive protein RarD
VPECRSSSGVAAMNSGILYALGAYLLWGLLPIYLHAIAAVPATEILAHRIVWSLVTVWLLLVVLRRRGGLRDALAQPARLRRFAVTALLITNNWLLYIWAIAHNHVVDASLGYFMNPLMNVVLGAVILHERLRPGQMVPVLIAAVGVAWLTWLAGSPPWVALGLAISFSLYGLLRKTAALGALEGFTIETGLLAPFALAWLVWLGVQGNLVFAQGSLSDQLLLMAAGPATTVPLLLFAAGARRISFSLLGVLQYVAPTLQWLTGVYLFHEPFDPHKAIGFGIIWLALALYAMEGAWFTWRQARAS